MEPIGVFLAIFIPTIVLIGVIFGGAIWYAMRDNRRR